MRQPSPGPIEADTFPAVCGYSHLFPGVRCRLRTLPDPAAFAADPWPIGVDLCFSDGVVAEAELRTGDPAGPVLAVAVYTTGAGTLMDGRTWPVREFAPAGDEVELTIGSDPSA